MAGEDFRADYAAAKVLAATVLQVHRSAFTEVLQARGIKISDWDSDALAQLTDTMYFSDVIPADVVYSGPLQTAPVPLLGAPLFRPIWSGVPNEYFYQQLAQHPSTPYSSVQNIEAPIKHIKVELHATDSIAAHTAVKYGHIFVGPDTPPLAVHQDDITYIERTTLPTVLDPVPGQYGLGVVNAVEAAFGPDNVQRLTTQLCQAVGAALLSSNPHCQPFED